MATYFASPLHFDDFRIESGHGSSGSEGAASLNSDPAHNPGFVAPDNGEDDVHDPAAPAASTSTPIKRKRGRPLGSKNKNPPERIDNGAAPAPAKRGRGRPRGSTNRKTTHEQDFRYQQDQQSRGRPRQFSEGLRWLLDSYRKQAPERLAKTKMSLERDYPRLSVAEFLSCSIKNKLWIDEVWPLHELVLEEFRNHLRAWCSNPRPHLQSLFRVTAWLMKCSPCDILHPSDGFIFACPAPLSRIALLGYDRLSPIWSDEFCRTLEVLVAHPFFAAEPAALRMAIRHAITARLQKRRPPPRSASSAHGVGASSSDASNDNLDTVQSRQRAEQARAKELEASSPLWSLLLRRLESTASVAGPEPGEGPAEPGPEIFEMRTSDLARLIEALDDIYQMGHPVYRPAALMHRETIEATSYHVPEGEDAETRVYERVFTTNFVDMEIDKAELNRELLESGREIPAHVPFLLRKDHPEEV